MAQTTFTDDFTAGAGDLAGSHVGSSTLTWADLVGTLTRGSGGLTGAEGSISTADVAWPDVLVAVTGGIGGMYAYARVQDANNWLRARLKTVSRVTSTTTYDDASYTFQGYVTG